jgi:peptidoglycan biosynthesis protein MviN/MurJ (putative lipid II flippase)
MVGLILANGAQLAGHAAVMIVLFERRVGTLRGHQIGRTLIRSLFAALLMGGVVYGVVWTIERLLPGAGRVGWALTVIAGGAIGLGVYGALCTLFRVPEAEMARELIGNVARRRRYPRQG